LQARLLPGLPSDIAFFILFSWPRKKCAVVDMEVQRGHPGNPWTGEQPCFFKYDSFFIDVLRQPVVL
jgi:hypothetical protein